MRTSPGRRDRPPFPEESRGKGSLPGEATWSGDDPSDRRGALAEEKSSLFHNDPHDGIIIIQAAATREGWAMRPYAAALWILLLCPGCDFSFSLAFVGGDGLPPVSAAVGSVHRVGHRDLLRRPCAPVGRQPGDGPVPRPCPLRGDAILRGVFRAGEFGEKFPVGRAAGSPGGG